MSSGARTVNYYLLVVRIKRNWMYCDQQTWYLIFRVALLCNCTLSSTPYPTTVSYRLLVSSGWSCGSSKAGSESL